MSDLKLDFDSLTLDEVELIEDATGLNISQIVDVEELSAKTAKALVWIMRRRSEPNLTIADCGGMTLAELSDFLSGSLGVDANPKGE